MGLHEDFYQPRLPINREPGDSPEAIPYSDSPISTYEMEAGKPFTATKLGFDKMDQICEIKVRALDEHIQKIMGKEGLRDSQIGYNTIFNRMVEKTGFSFEEAAKSGKAGKVLDALFTQIALMNRVSSMTFLRGLIKQYDIRRVESLKSQLRAGMKALATS